MLKIAVTVVPAGGGPEQRIAWMEITNKGLTPEAAAEEAKYDTINPGGERFYDARWNDGRGRTSFADKVRHRRSGTVWDLVRAVLNHSEPQPGYCSSCGRQD